MRVNLFLFCFSASFVLSQSGEPPTDNQGADVVVIKKLKDGSKNITSDLLHDSAQSVTTPVTEVPGPELTTELPVDDNVMSVKKDMAVPSPGDDDHRNSAKKDLDMTSEDSGPVRGRKGVGESGSVSGRKGVEDDALTEDKPVSPDTTMPPTDAATANKTAAKTKTEKEGAGDVKSLLKEVAAATDSTTNQPLLEVATHPPSNGPAKNLNKVPTGSEETKWSLLNHHPVSSSSDSDHAKDLETLLSKNEEMENKGVKSSEEAVGSTGGSSSSTGSLVFGVILAMILISSVLFVGVKKIEAIRRRREYRRMNDFLIDGMYNDS